MILNSLQKLNRLIQPIMLVTLFFLVTNSSLAQHKLYKAHTVAFYNLENLFDTIRNEQIYDEAFTPKGDYGWNTERYNNKLQNMSFVLPRIGTSSVMKTPPAVIGVCEIENRTVLEDIVSMPSMEPYGYQIIHQDSPDERGIDTGFLYREDVFTPDSFKTFKTELPDSTDRTRDILLVSGELDGERMHFTVNHWPSRSGGEKISMPNREAAAKNLKQIVDSIETAEPGAKIISMGDFNDDPISPSIKDVLGATGKLKNLTKGAKLYNPFYEFYKKGFGTTAWRDAWSLFDMLIVSDSLIDAEDGFKYVSANRYTPNYLLQDKGRFKGYPKRTHSFGNYLNGFSDHFPVYIYVAKEIEE